MRCWNIFILIPVLAALVLSGCAARKTATPPKPHPTGFASADAKNVHDFLARYQSSVNGGDEKALLRLYAEDARMVPYLVENKRVLTKKDLAARLPYITKMQHKAGMRLAFREPMDIQVPASGETAQVRMLADLTWKEAGKPRRMVLDCYFRLVREDFVWKIKESHQEAAAPGQTHPGKGALPAVRSGPPAPQGTDGKPQPIIPDGEQQHPQPLF
jgi:ketosteroid isomerase-like protein